MSLLYAKIIIYILQEPDVSKMEEKIGAGQIEEVISQAKAELKLARIMVEYRPWEEPINSSPPNQWKWPL